jgi:pimeloyl-ACP methyl ester carboxylesterase
MHHPRHWVRLAVMALSLALAAAGCVHTPAVPYSMHLDPLAFGPGSSDRLTDGRARFREIFCAATQDHGSLLPDPMPCDESLARVGVEPAATGRPVNLGSARSDFLTLLVPGLGFECVRDWLDADESSVVHAAEYGYEVQLLEVSGLASSAANARMIRDRIEALPPEHASRPLVLIGYSKGAPDILEALVEFPQLAERVVAVVAYAGAIRGSPLADRANPSQLSLLTHIPGSECEEDDRGALDSLSPQVRNAWLADHALPRRVQYYSVVSFPDPSRISRVLRPSYRKLAELKDARNDSQLVFHDQVIPGSTVLAFVNADHWAMGVPVARQHQVTEALFATENDFPREIMLEALLRYLDEALATEAPIQE